MEDAKEIKDNLNTDLKKKDATPGRPRNLGLSVLLIFSFVYNGLLLLLVIVGLFYPALVNDTLQQYYKHTYISVSLSFLLNLAFSIILGLSFYGLLLLWWNKKKGFIFFASAQLIILLTLLLVFRSYDWINIAVILMILIILWFSSRSMD